jgi:RNA polymerase sigma factor (sigma-70 family)
MSPAVGWRRQKGVDRVLTFDGPTPVRKAESSAAARQGRADDEAPLRAALAAGDHRVALMELMRLYGREVFDHCQWMLKDRARAEDVSQKTFIKAYDSFATFAGRSTLRSWLFGIARHRCLDEIKASRRSGRQVANSAPPEVGQAPVAEERLHETELSAALEKCLEGLPTHTRIVVLMRYKEEMSYEEIGAALREKPKTVERRVSRAMPLLRDCMSEKGFGV